LKLIELIELNQTAALEKRGGFFVGKEDNSDWNCPIPPMGGIRPLLSDLKIAP
jgi:hypothetical protein